MGRASSWRKLGQHGEEAGEELGADAKVLVAAGSCCRCSCRQTDDHERGASDSAEQSALSSSIPEEGGLMMQSDTGTAKEKRERMIYGAAGLAPRCFKKREQAGKVSESKQGVKANGCRGYVTVSNRPAEEDKGSLKESTAFHMKIQRETEHENETWLIH